MSRLERLMDPEAVRQRSIAEAVRQRSIAEGNKRAEENRIKRTQQVREREKVEMAKVADVYQIITGGYGDNPLGGGLFSKIDKLLYEGFIPIGGLTIDAKGNSYQVMYRNDEEYIAKLFNKADALKRNPIESSLIDLTDPATTPIQETLAGVFESNGGKRNIKKSKKYVSKRKNKTKKRN